MNHKQFVLNLSEKLNLRSSNKHVALQTCLFITRGKKTDSSTKNNKLKITVPTQNDESELPDGYIDYIMKDENHETFANPPIHIYINKINDRLVLQIKDGYKVELKTPETIKLSGSIKN